VVLIRGEPKFTPEGIKIWKTLRKKFSFKPMADHSGGIPGLSEPARLDAAHDANQVLEALAEGFRLELAGT
jgi:hypothetical protein